MQCNMFAGDEPEPSKYRTRQYASIKYGIYIAIVQP